MVVIVGVKDITSSSMFGGVDRDKNGSAPQILRQGLGKKGLGGSHS